MKKALISSFFIISYFYFETPSYAAKIIEVSLQKALLKVSAAELQNLSIGSKVEIPLSDGSKAEAVVTVLGKDFVRLEGKFRLLKIGEQVVIKAREEKELPKKVAFRSPVAVLIPLPPDRPAVLAMREDKDNITVLPGHSTLNVKLHLKDSSTVADPNALTRIETKGTGDIVGLQGIMVGTPELRLGANLSLLNDSQNVEFTQSGLDAKVKSTGTTQVTSFFAAYSFTSRWALALELEIQDISSKTHTFVRTVNTTGTGVTQEFVSAGNVSDKNSTQRLAPSLMYTTDHAEITFEWVPTTADPSLPGYSRGQGIWPMPGGKSYFSGALTRHLLKGLSENLKDIFSLTLGGGLLSRGYHLGLELESFFQAGHEENQTTFTSESFPGNALRISASTLLSAQHTIGLYAQAERRAGTYGPTAKVELSTDELFLYYLYRF